jgi:hypothetical protein
VAGRFVEIGRDDVSALVGESADYLDADAAGRTRHHDDLVSESVRADSHLDSSFFVRI